jgi:TetR/AcrR family transcriptional repressor of mexJK operon
MNLEQDVTTRRGRPKSEEKRENIREAAANLFLEEGYERCSMDSIAAAAGVSKQTVYSHFENKDELFRCCIVKKVEMYDLRVRTSEHDDLESGLASFADGFLRLVSDPQAVKMWRLMVNEAEEHSRVAEMFYETGPGESLQSLADFLELHRDRLDTEDYMGAARTFLALTGDTYHSRILRGVIDQVEDEDRRRHVARVTRQFMRLFGAAGDSAAREPRRLSSASSSARRTASSSSAKDAAAS